MCSSDLLLHFRPMVNWGAIDKDDLECLTFCDSPDDAFGILKKHLETYYLTPTTAHEAAVPAIAKTRTGGPGAPAEKGT